MRIKALLAFLGIPLIITNIAYANEPVNTEKAICLGYNSIRLPQDIVIKEQTAEVDFFQFEVLEDTSGRPEHVIRNQANVGQILFENKVGDWKFVSAVANEPGNEPPLFLVLIAASRVGDDIVIAQTKASVSLVGNGDGTELRAMFHDMHVKPVTEVSNQRGFCVSDYRFSY